MNWLSHIENELKRVTPGENPGRTRTIARRIAGIALQHYYADGTKDFLQLINNAKDDPAFPDDVRSAIGRLAARLDAQFSSPSTDPVGDALIVVDFIRDKTS
jgi:hypothetical protein